MKLSGEHKIVMDKSVLCWLATVAEDGMPNVSPKEIFTYIENSIIIANIASPQTVSNIKAKAKASVCISFIDILVQKGFQVKGEAEVIEKSDDNFSEMEAVLLRMTAGKFPFASITKISPLQIKPIIAPRYMLYPDTTEKEQIERAKAAYRL